MPTKTTRVVSKKITFDGLTVTGIKRTHGSTVSNSIEISVTHPFIDNETRIAIHANILEGINHLVLGLETSAPCEESDTSIPKDPWLMIPFDLRMG